MLSTTARRKSRARADMGFRFVTVSSDARLLAAGSQAILQRMRAP
ncbi:hypothetical protein [Variovorax sp. J22R115]